MPTRPQALLPALSLINAHLTCYRVDNIFVEGLLLFAKFTCPRKEPNQKTAETCDTSKVLADLCLGSVRSSKAFYILYPVGPVPRCLQAPLPPPLPLHTHTHTPTSMTLETRYGRVLFTLIFSLFSLILSFMAWSSWVTRNTSLFMIWDRRKQMFNPDSACIN